MENSSVCLVSNERIVSVSRDRGSMEAKMFLDCNPRLAMYSTFSGLNSPFYFTTAEGRNEIVALLLENEADVNPKSYNGHTTLMRACRYGYWEVVQVLLLFRCNVTRADYLSRRIYLHFAVVNGHNAYDQSALAKSVNKAASGGITTLHVVALNGYTEHGTSRDPTYENTLECITRIMSKTVSTRGMLVVCKCLVRRRKKGFEAAYSATYMDILCERLEAKASGSETCNVVLARSHFKKEWSISLLYG
ncbi:hypothetical protein AAG906_018214 [Vitis piasezkii]